MKPESLAAGRNRGLWFHLCPPTINPRRGAVSAADRRASVGLRGSSRSVPVEAHLIRLQWLFYLSSTIGVAQVELTAWTTLPIGTILSFWPTRRHMNDPSYCVDSKTEILIRKNAPQGRNTLEQRRPIRDRAKSVDKGKTAPSNS